jgi:prepilin-type N-terminal cleavage/methylation domain-containing protein
MFQSEVKQLRLLTKKQAIKQKGYSIIELSIALAIISIILVTSLAGVQRVLRSNNLNNELKIVQLGIAHLGTLLANATTTSGITSSTVISLKSFDGFQADTTNNLYKNTFGGYLYVESNNAAVGSVPANSGFILTTTNIPPEICVDYLNALSNIATQLSASNSNYSSDGKLATKDAMQANVVKAIGGTLDISTLAAACTVTSAKPKVNISAFIAKY